MATLGRLVRAWRVTANLKALNPSLLRSNTFFRRLHHRPYDHQIHRPLLLPCANAANSVLPAVLAGLFGAGTIQVAYSDNDQPAPKPSLPSESPSNYKDLQEIASEVKRRLEDLVKSKGMNRGFYHRFTVAVKGQKVTIKFQIEPTCDVPQLIAVLVSNLGLKVDERGGGSDMLLRAWDSAVAWQLTLSRPEKQKDATQDNEHSEDTNTPVRDLCVLLFRSLISNDKPEIEFIKSGGFSLTELDAIVSVLQLARGKIRTSERKPGEGAARMPSAEKSVTALESMGVRIYGLDGAILSSSNTDISWDDIAGYDQQKREIEDSILLALQSPATYDDIARGTRQKFESNRPRAVLFEGPPGTGKTSCARVIANQAGVPLLYVPLEVVVSKYYGESEQLLGKVFTLANELPNGAIIFLDELLGKVFTLANELPNGAIIFLDEVDSFAIARDSEMHEATRRILSVLLRQIDGFEKEKKVVVVAATNRKQDLDPALVSRFDAMITFGLPDQHNRQKIIAQYAKHLTQSDTEEFARVTEEDIRDVCQQAERSWASKIIRGQVEKDGEGTCLPPLSEYVESAMNRRRALLSIAEERSRGLNPRKSRGQLEML